MIEWKTIGHKTVKRILDTTKLYPTIFWGPPGIGKTTIATEYAIVAAATMRGSFYSCSGPSLTTAQLREYADSDTPLVLLIDEIQYLNKKQQQVLLTPLERNQNLLLLATTTENPNSFCLPAILSRCRSIRMRPPSIEEIESAFKDAAEPQILRALIEKSGGDIRRLKTDLEMYDSIEDDEDLEEILGVQHIDASTESLKSAYQKSVRGSNPDAACLYAEQLCEKGELEALCRRMRVIVSEDVGLANYDIVAPVTACINNALALGMPEARIPIIEATLLMALSPKSNSVVIVNEKYDELRKSGRNIAPPPNIASAGARNYIYPHDFKYHWVEQKYLPEEDMLLYWPQGHLYKPEQELITHYVAIRTKGAEANGRKESSSEK